FPQGFTEIVVGTSPFRLEPQGLPGAGDRLVELPLLLQRGTKVQVDAGVVRLEAKGLPMAGDGLIQLPLLLQRGTEIRAVRGEVRAEVNNFPEVGNRIIELVQMEVAHAAVAISDVVIRPEGDAGGEVGDGLWPAIDLFRGEAH